MKKVIFSLVMIIGLTPLINAQENTTDESGKIYFLRSTGYSASATAFKVFIDEQYVCKIKNKEYSIHDVSPGKHICSVKFYGKKSKPSDEKFEVVVEAGKSVYINIVLRTSTVESNTFCEEITENTEKNMIGQFSQNNKCR